MDQSLADQLAAIDACIVEAENLVQYFEEDDPRKLTITEAIEFLWRVRHFFE